jgi:hypothetical protein
MRRRRLDDGGPWVSDDDSQWGDPSGTDPLGIAVIVAVFLLILLAGFVHLVSGLA